VRADTQNGRMHVAVRGPHQGQRPALAVIRSVFRAIHATLKGLEAEERVPLPDNPAVTVAYKHLLQLERLGQRQFLPEGADRLYDVQELLNGIEEKAARQDRADLEEVQEQTVLRTIVELDLSRYTDAARQLEDQLDVDAVARLDDQVQEFVNAGLSFIRRARDDAVFRTAGDNAVLVLDKAELAHHFVAAVYQATQLHNSGRRSEAQRRFRYGAATGKVILKSQGGRRDIAGTTIITAVRLEAAGQADHFLIDHATYAALPPGLQVLYSPDTVRDKHQDEYRAYRWVLGEDGGAPDQPPAESRGPRSFDVFLSHSSKDKAQVKEFGEALKARRLKVWLDVWKLVPGRPWYEGLEEILETVGARPSWWVREAWPRGRTWRCGSACVSLWIARCRSSRCCCRARPRSRSCRCS
jgi:hypothetical protein